MNQNLLVLNKNDEALIAKAREKSLDKRKPSTSPKLKEVFAKLGGVKGAIDLARNSISDNPEMALIVQIWDEMMPEERKNLEIEQLCNMVGLRSGDFIGLIAKAAWEINRPLADFVVAMAVPQLTQVSIDAALDVEKGFKDREALLRKAGVHPEKGSLVSVSQTNQTLVQNHGSLPKFEDDARRFDKLLNGAIDGEIVDDSKQPS